MAKVEPKLTKINYSSRDVRRSQIKNQESIGTQIYAQFSLVKPLELKRLAIENLIYRLENGRTRSQQAAFASHRGENRSWFSAHQEDQTRQFQQHRFLWDLAQEQAGTEGISIVAALREARVQTQPLLITADGVVVDGNRRLCTMRELSVVPEFSDYRYAVCAVLPPETTERDIRLLEVAVQMAPETKLKYSWVNDGLTYRSLEEEGLKPEEIAEAVGHGVKATVIRERLAALDEADIFLSEYAREPGNYDLVEKSFTAFKNLAAATKNIRLEVEKHRTRAACHALIARKDRLGDRVYSYIQPLKDQSRVMRIYELLASRKEIEIPEDFSPVSISENEDDLFEGLEDDVVLPHDRMASYLADPHHLDQVVEGLKNAAEAMLDERALGDLAERPLRIIRKAVGDLNPIGPDDIVYEHAAEVKSQAERLIEKLFDLVEGAEAHLQSDD